MSKLQKAYESIKPTEEEKEKISENILSENKEIYNMTDKIKFKRAVPVAFAAVVLATGVFIMNGNKNEDIIAHVESITSPEKPETQIPPAASPMPGMRKF